MEDHAKLEPALADVDVPPDTVRRLIYVEHSKAWTVQWLAGEAPSTISRKVSPSASMSDEDLEA